MMLPMQGCMIKHEARVNPTRLSPVYGLVKHHLQRSVTCGPVQCPSCRPHKQPSSAFCILFGHIVLYIQSYHHQRSELRYTFWSNSRFMSSASRGPPDDYLMPTWSRYVNWWSSLFTCSIVSNYNYMGHNFYRLAFYNLFVFIINVPTYSFLLSLISIMLPKIIWCYLVKHSEVQSV